MSGITAGDHPSRARQGGFGLFPRRWAANPLQMGRVVPSSRALGRRIAALVERRGGEVVVEIVPDMARTLPGVRVIEGDAFALAEARPAARHGRVGSAICGIPLVLLPMEQQRRFVAAVEAVAPARGFLLYRYCITSPLPWHAPGLTARREAWTPASVPPASVWRYHPVG